MKKETDINIDALLRDTFLTQFHHRQKRVAQHSVDIDIRLFFQVSTTANSSGFTSPMVPLA